MNTQLKSAEIVALPLNQLRNDQPLINLVPGATPAEFQNTQAFTPARSLSVNVNGQNRNNNGRRTARATNLNIWLPHHMAGRGHHGHHQVRHDPRKEGSRR